VFNVHPGEILVIALVLLIVVGPEQLPGVVRKVGKALAQFKEMSNNLKNDFMATVDADPLLGIDAKKDRSTSVAPVLEDLDQDAIDEATEELDEDDLDEDDLDWEDQDVSSTSDPDELDENPLQKMEVDDE